MCDFYCFYYFAQNYFIIIYVTKIQKVKLKNKIILLLIEKYNFIKEVTGLVQRSTVLTYQLNKII
jgi:hypothetical protein